MLGRTRKITTLTDQELLNTYRKKKDQKVIGELFKRYSHLVFGVCLKYLGNEEESKDAVMKIFEKLMSDLKTHEVEQFKPWLHTVSRNHCLMHLRKHKKQWYKETDVDQVRDLSSDEQTNQSEVKEEQLQNLEKAMVQLSGEQRQCVEMFYINQLSYADVAKTTGLTLKQVKSHIQNGKRNLRLILMRNREQSLE